MENIRTTEFQVVSKYTFIQILHVFEVRSYDTKEMLDRHMFTGHIGLKSNQLCKFGKVL